MLRMRKIGVASILLSLAAACAVQTGGSRVAARVVSLQRGATDARGLVPVVEAHVLLRCPTGEAREIGATSAEGTLLLDAEKPVPLDCKLAIEHPGHRAVSVAVTEVCRTQAGAFCRVLDVRTVLQPEGANMAAAH